MKLYYLINFPYYIFQILNLIESDHGILNPLMRTYAYTSSTGMEFLSVVISFNLQERTNPTGIVESITNILQNNASLNFTKEFQVVAFQPSRKYYMHS